MAMARKGRWAGQATRLAAGAALGLSGWLGAVGAAGAEPAMWVARDDDSTVYMLGTFHVLDEGRSWTSPAFDDAFYGADELWLEVDVLKEARKAFGLMARYGTSPDRTLSSRLTEAERAKLKIIAARAGIPVSALENLRPWLAYLTLSLGLLKATGLTEEGVDVWLAKEANAMSMPLHGLETLEEQIRIMAGIDDEAQMEALREGLRQGLDDETKLVALSKALVDAWAAGDDAAIERLMVVDMGGPGDPVYDAMLTRRNRNFATQIERMMDGAGTHFVAVGAAHFVGPDSVQRFLAEKGIASERMPPSAGPQEEGETEGTDQKGAAPK